MQNIDTNPEPLPVGAENGRRAPAGPEDGFDEPQSPPYRVTRHEVYEVMYEPRVAIRNAPSMMAGIAGAMVKGKAVVAVDYCDGWIRVEGSFWDPEWMLIDGKPLGLGPLLEHKHVTEIGKKIKDTVHARYEKMKAAYQVAKHEDRLDEAMAMRKAIQEFEADQENNGVAAAIGAELCPPPPPPTPKERTEQKKKKKQKRYRRARNPELHLNAYDYETMTEVMLKMVYVQHNPELKNLMDKDITLTFPDSKQPIRGRKAVTLAFGRTAEYWRHVDVGFAIMPGGVHSHWTECIMAMRRTEDGETKYWKHVVSFGKPPDYQVEKWVVTDMSKPKIFAGSTKEEIVGQKYDDVEGCYVGDGGDDEDLLEEEEVAPADYMELENPTPPPPPGLAGIDYDPENLDDLDEPIVEDVGDVQQ